MHLLPLRCVLSFCPLKRLLRRRRQRSRSQEGFPWCVLNNVDECIFGWCGLLIRPPRTFPIVLLLFGLDGYQLRCFVVARRCAGALQAVSSVPLSGPWPSRGGDARRTHGHQCLAGKQASFGPVDLSDRQGSGICNSPAAQACEQAAKWQALEPRRLLFWSAPTCRERSKAL